MLNCSRAAMGNGSQGSTFSLDGQTVLVAWYWEEMRARVQREGRVGCSALVLFSPRIRFRKSPQVSHRGPSEKCVGAACCCQQPSTAGDGGLLGFTVPGTPLRGFKCQQRMCNQHHDGAEFRAAQPPAHILSIQRKMAKGGISGSLSDTELTVPSLERPTSPSEC